MELLPDAMHQLNRFGRRFATYYGHNLKDESTVIACLASAGITHRNKVNIVRYLTASPVPYCARGADGEREQRQFYLEKVVVGHDITGYRLIDLPVMDLPVALPDRVAPREHPFTSLGQ